MVIVLRTVMAKKFGRELVLHLHKRMVGNIVMATCLKNVTAIRIAA